MKSSPPQQMSIEDFNYHLPPDRIAWKPLPQRDQARLLVYGDGKISESTFEDLDRFLPPDSILVANDTKVIHARLRFLNPHGTAIELFLLEPVAPFTDMSLAIFHHGPAVWRCLVGRASKWRDNELIKSIRYGTAEGEISAVKKGRSGEDYLIEFAWTPPSLSFAQAIQAAGTVPLPPYIKRTATAEDESRYQTVYAYQDGSVAAPTAGLHFTEAVFTKLKAKGIQSLFATLHVGAGTFLPVRSATIGQHAMHQEQICIHAEILKQLIERKSQPVVCLGTTSLRMLESLYWLGLQLLQGKKEMLVEQWVPYETHGPLPDRAESFAAVLDWMSSRKQVRLVAETKILIAPGYRFQCADGLITNFHLPKSTLLLLIAAFIGSDWKKVYDEALQRNFRFLSYGDGSLLWRKNPA